MVTVGGELLELFEFGRVVDGAEGAVASAVDMDPVGDFVVFFPHPVFFANGGLNGVMRCVPGGDAEEATDEMLLQV